MTTFVTRMGARRFRSGVAARAMAAIGICLAGAGISPAVRAQTQGAYPANGNDVLAAFGYGGGLVNPGSTANPRTVVDLTTSIYGYITNKYIGAVLGSSGSFTVDYGAASFGSISYSVPGRLAFGNKKGSLVRGTKDDNRSLTGFETFGDGYPVWPLASDASVPTKFYYDYCGYVSAIVDSTATGGGTQKHFLNAADFIIPPLFKDNTLDATLNGGNNIRIRQVIRLLRSTAQITWTITNNDTASHSVGLRLAMNLRNSVLTGSDRSGAVYFVDPTVGRTSRTRIYQNGNVPSQIDVLQTRVDQDPTTSAFGLYPYHARHILSGFNATPPDVVAVVDSNFLRSQPTPTVYLPRIGTADSQNAFYDGLATAIYWNPTTIPAGGSRTITTYFGNGAATEDLGSLSYTTGTEAIESLGFDTTAANSAAFTSGKRDDPAKSTLFYTPSQFTVYGSLYNRSLTDAQFAVILRNVTMSLNLPNGLQFVNDTSQRNIGDVQPDTDAQTSWTVQANGTDYGALAYQMVTTIPGVGSSTLSRVVNVPASPLHAVSTAGFQMISFPFEFNPTLSNNADPQTVVNGINDPNDGKVSMYQYIPEIQNYQLATQLQTGVGYFYRPNTNRTIIAKGVIPLANQAPNGTDQSVPFQVFLKAGWNMIGDPYVYNIPLNYVQIISPSDVNNPLSFTQAVNAGLVRGGVYFRTTDLSGYDLIANYTDLLVPWQGYWIYLNNDAFVKFLNVTAINSVVQGPRPNGSGTTPDPTQGVTRKATGNNGAFASGRAVVAQPTLDNWKLQMVARRNDGHEDGTLLIGEFAGSKDGADVHDLPKPPAPFANYVYTGIVHDSEKTRYAQDLKAPGGTKTWDVEVSSDTGGPVSLLWPNTSTLPRRLRLKIKDVANGHVTNLRSASALTVTLQKGTVHRFQITADLAPSRPLALSNIRSIPTGRSNGYAFGVTVNQDATMSARITTLGGKQVKTLVTGRAATEGENRINWDGRSEQGYALPAGTYQMEVTVRGDDGQPVISKVAVTTVK